MKPLMSEVLKGTQAALSLADSCDVTKLREFLLAEPQKPMLFVGNGGMQGHFAAMLYEENAGIALPLTPYMLRSISDEALRSCRCLLMSDGGHNIDITDATKRMAKVNPDNTGGFTSVDSPENILIKKLKPENIFLFRRPDNEGFRDGFISVGKQFFRDALFYKAFTGKSAAEQMTVDLDPAHCYSYELNHSEGPLTPLSKIRHILVLHGGKGAPAAHYIESVLAESGMISAQVTDYLNFCHGRFIFASNHTRHDTKKHTLPESDTAVLLLVTPEEEKIANNIRKTAPKGDWQVLPNETPVITIRSEYTDALSAIDLHVKASVFLADLGENHLGNNPFSPNNFCRVNKKFPKCGLRW